MIRSTALEANIRPIHVEIDPKYDPIKAVMSGYQGLMERLNTFLEELSHPQRNLQFVVSEARTFALDYIYLFKKHPQGPEAVSLYGDIFMEVIGSGETAEVMADAADTLIFFLDKIVQETGDAIGQFIPVVNQVFFHIGQLDESRFFLFLKSCYRIKKVGLSLQKAIESGQLPDLPTNGLDHVIDFFFRYYRQTYDYWLSIPDPLEWFIAESEEIHREPAMEEMFEYISHGRIIKWQQALEKLEKRSEKNPRLLEMLLQFPGFHHFTDTYRDLPFKLWKMCEKPDRGNRFKMIFLFHIMNIEGLSTIHEETLREINRTVSWLISRETQLYVENLIKKTFSILTANWKEYPITALNCVLNMGRGIYKTDDADLINLFIDSVIDLGFQSPMIQGVGNDWQIQANPAHVHNIRTWLELIKLNPLRSTRLISGLIIHLSLSGVFIKDTDLFFRDITGLLNSDIEPVYNLIKQLARLFPVYFNDIGAEGILRDISTEIDEVGHRRDLLVHFLRKQTHVESNNRIVGFMEAVLEFWAGSPKSCVESYVPPEIYCQIEEQGEFVDGMRRIFTPLKDQVRKFPKDLLAWEQPKVQTFIETISNVSETDRKRATLAISLYRLLYQKYDLSSLKLGINAKNVLGLLQSESFPEPHRLESALDTLDPKDRIFKLLDYLEMLKQVILSEEEFAIQEDIYKKRHIAIDIPSTYGSYHEKKFDALGLTFRIESLVNVLFEQIIDTIDSDLITKATFTEIYDLLSLFDKALKADGIKSIEMERQLEILSHSLDVKGFTFTQYLDIFKGMMQSVRNIVNDYYNNVHQQNLNRILEQVPTQWLLPKFKAKMESTRLEGNKHRVFEIFSRDRIATSLGLQQLDLFLTRILNTLFRQKDKLDPEMLHQLLLYDPNRAMTSIYDQKGKASGIIFLGNKGLNLIRLKNLGYPIPPGFIITTEVYRCRKIINSYRSALDNFKDQVLRHIKDIERLTGKQFGNAANPLLFSVRSGSSISQPGMLDTFLDVGMNEDIAEGMAAKTNEWFAWDNYRRFLQCYGMSCGIQRDDFDAIIMAFKKRLGVKYKREFPGYEMKAAAMTYKQMINDLGFEIETEPFAQLMETIQRVLNSWESPKAKTYRKIIGISDDWGTAVTVQSMVFGNISSQSGTGVFFTHDPRWSGDSPRLWGDFTIGNQGEDVVSGLVTTLPISIVQQETEKRDTDTTLETHFPEIYGALKRWVTDLIERKGWSPQEIEFTFQGPSESDLYLLQSRDMAIRERKKVLTFDAQEITEDRFLGHGVGVSGGAMSGRIVFTPEEIDNWRKQEPQTALILVRRDTVPDDISEIHAADGLLTSRGGLTSHAAVVAHGLGKTCVVGCGNMICKERERKVIFGDITLKSGDFISIDGREGSVFNGQIKILEENAVETDAYSNSGMARVGCPNFH